MSRILITPEELYAASSYMTNRLESITSEMNALKSQVDDTMSRWEGRAKEAFYPLFNETHGQVQNALTESIQGLSNGIYQSARALEETDGAIAGSMSQQ